MKRISMTARAGWEGRIEQQGLVWHDEGGRETWNEQAVYLLRPEEVENLCRAAGDLATIYYQATEHVVKNNLWGSMGLQDHEAKLLVASWERDEWSLHGRFDFLFDAE